MENVLLVIHLILALCLITVVLLQRSEGGGLGMNSGGGAGGGGVMTGRQAATALAKITWIFAALFFCTSIALTILAARNGSTGSVMDQTTAPAASTSVPAVPQNSVPAAKDLLPPSTTDTPTAPPRAGN